MALVLKKRHPKSTYINLQSQWLPYIRLFWTLRGSTTCTSTFNSSEISCHTWSHNFQAQVYFNSFCVIHLQACWGIGKFQQHDDKIYMHRKRMAFKYAFNHCFMRLLSSVRVKFISTCTLLDTHVYKCISWTLRWCNSQLSSADFSQQDDWCNNLFWYFLTLQLFTYEFDDILWCNNQFPNDMANRGLLTCWNCFSSSRSKI